MSDKITRRCCNDSAPHEPDEENGYLIDIEDIAALDAEYAGKIGRPTEKEDYNRYLAELTIIELLRKLGCDKTADAFERLPKWYA